MLPHDPMILLSYVNTLLRDSFPSLEDLCEDQGVAPDTVTAALAAVGFQYDEGSNQFR